MRSLWVARRARGQGVADRLVTEVERWARATGGTTLRLAVLPGNGAALALCRRHGFAPLAQPGDLLADGVTREVPLEKPLG